MDVVPVIDLMRSQVVHGVAGQRANYQPVRSSLCQSALPKDVASAFRELGFEQAYVADLDAIRGDRLDEASLLDVAGSGLKIWLDPGLADERQAERILANRAVRSCLGGLIVGLESLPDPRSIESMAASIGPELGVFSLDLHGGRLLNERAAWQHVSPTDVADIAWGAGFRRLIVLDVAQVGTSRGVSTGELCRKVRARQPGWHLTGGGGLRGLRDLEQLAGCGCDAALVASALHSGALTSDEIRAIERVPQPNNADLGLFDL